MQAAEEALTQAQDALILVRDTFGGRFTSGKEESVEPITQLAAVTEDPVRIRNRMSGAVSAVVTDSKKITKDDQRRTANDRRAAQRQGDKTARKENYNSKHLANPKSQNKWRKQSRQNKVAKRKNRAEQAKKKADMRGPRTNRPRR